MKPLSNFDLDNLDIVEFNNMGDSYKQKEMYVSLYVAPCLQHAGIGVEDVKYFLLKDGREIVVIWYESGYVLEVNVTLDSRRAILEDVVRGLHQ